MLFFVSFTAHFIEIDWLVGDDAVIVCVVVFVKMNMRECVHKIHFFSVFFFFYSGKND